MHVYDYIERHYTLKGIYIIYNVKHMLRKASNIPQTMKIFVSMEKRKSENNEIALKQQTKRPRNDPVGVRNAKKPNKERDEITVNNKKNDRNDGRSVIEPIQSSEMAMQDHSNEVNRQEYTDGKMKARNEKSNKKSSNKAVSGEKKNQPRLYVKKTFELSIALYPAAVLKLDNNINNCIASYLLKYSDQIGGILLAYNNMKLLANGQGMIFNEQPHLHYRVRVDGLVFCPYAGCQLHGIVTESFHSHISLNVLGYVSASIHSTHLQAAGYEFDPKTYVWYDKKGSKKPLAPNVGINFICIKLHESGGIVSLTGSNPEIKLR